MRMSTGVAEYFNSVVLVRRNAIESLEITDSVQSITITESVFQSCVTCTISILDTSEFVNTYPVTGYETVMIEGLDGETFSYDIYSIKDFNNSEGNRVGFSLCFISDVFLLNQQLKISQSYKNKTIQEIVEDIFKSSFSKTKSEGNIDISEKTKGKYNLIIPNKSPLDAINWLCSNALRQDNDGSNFLFYETLRKGYIFSSLESLIDASSNSVEYKRVMSVNDIRAQKDVFMFSEFGTEYRFDTILGINSGLYSSSLMTHSLIDRKYDIAEFDYLKTFGGRSNFKTLGDITLMEKGDADYNTSFDSKKFFIPSYKHSYNHNKFSLDKGKVLPIRVSQLEQINSNRVTISTRGNYERHAGEVIGLTNSIVNSVTLGMKDKKTTYDGLHYVLGVKHMISAHEHITMLQLSKDGLDRG